MMKNNKKGFTLVEIIVVISILIVIAGIFSVNMISSLKNNKEEENKNVVTQIRSAAEAYVSTNPDEVKKLYEGYGYVDIPVGDLRDAGLLSEDLKDAETGEKISDNELVRVSLQTGDFVVAKYPLTNEEKNEKAYTLFAEDLNVEYDKDVTTSSWCSNNSNIYAGLYDRKKYNEATYASVESKLYLMDNAYETKGEMYTGDHLAAPVNLKMTSCNVNPQVAGTYTINYKFTDPKQGNEKTTSRTVYVRTSSSDVISFTATINDGQKIVLNTASVPILITEKYKDGSSLDIPTTNDKITNVKYSLENFTTNEAGDRIAVVSTTKTNSDGSTPKPADAAYSVTDNLVDMFTKSDDPMCVKSPTSGSTCYIKDDGPNYIEYYDELFRIYAIDGNYIKVILDHDYTKGPYGQIGGCILGCCNNGRYAYTGLGENEENKVAFAKVMENYLDDFHNSLNFGLSINDLISQSYTTFTNVTNYSLRTTNNYYNGFSTSDNIVNKSIETKTLSITVGLLQLGEYKEIAMCNDANVCTNTDNYISKGSNEFWLYDFYGANFGVKAHNVGVEEASVYHYAVRNGEITHAGATKPQGSQVVTTEELGIRPTLTIATAKITSGIGTKRNPYVIKK